MYYFSLSDLIFVQQYFRGRYSAGQKYLAPARKLLISSPFKVASIHLKFIYFCPGYSRSR